MDPTRIHIVQSALPIVLGLLVGGRRKRGRESGGRDRVSVDPIVFFGGRLPSGTDSGEGGGDLADMAYTGLTTFIAVIAGPEAQPLVLYY